LHAGKNDAGWRPGEKKKESEKRKSVCCFVKFFSWNIGGGILRGSIMGKGWEERTMGTG